MGRAAEIRRLDQVLEAAAGGATVLALITGESGIGKTALVRTMSERAARRRFRVAWSAGTPESVGEPFGLWSQLVAQCLRAAPDAGAVPIPAELGSAGADLTDRRFSPTGMAAPSVQSLASAVIAFWAAAAARGPLLLVLEDLHRADLESVRLLHALATVMHHEPIAIVATRRVDGPPDAAFEDGWLEVERAADIALTLHGLSRSSIGELARQWGLVDPPPLMLELIERRSGGNPLFAKELLRSMGPVEGRPSMLTLAGVLPETVVHEVRHRLAALDPVAVDLLNAAAVIGATGELGALAAWAGTTIDEVADRLETAIRDRLLSVSQGRWRFIHEVVRDVAYRSLPVATRPRLHARALKALQAIGAPVVEQAWHLRYTVDGLDRSLAVEVLVEAGRRHLAQQAYELAVVCLTRAVELGSDIGGDAVGQSRRLLLLGEALSYLGETAEADAAFRGAAQLGDSDPDLLGSAVLGPVNTSVMAELTYGRHLRTEMSELRRALDRFGQLETPVRVRLLARLSFELARVGDRKAAHATANEAADMALRIDDPLACVVAALAHFRIQVLGGHALSDQLAESSAMLEQASRSGDRRGIHAAYRSQFVHHLMAGDLPSADADLLDLARLTAELGVATFEWWWVALWRGLRALLSANYAEAEAQIDRARATVHPAQRTEAELNWFAQWFFLCRERGNLRRTRAELPGLGPPAPLFDALLGLRAAELGELEGARDVMDRLVTTIPKLREEREWGGIWFLLARIAFLLRDPGTAALLMDEGHDRTGQCVVIGLPSVCVGSADLALAWLAELIGDTNESDRLYRAATDLNARMDAPAWLAQTRLDHAALLARRKDSDDQPNALRLVTLAANAAERIGAVHILAPANELLAGLRREATNVAGPSSTMDGETPAVVTVTRPAVAVGRFQLSGASWTIEFEGLIVHVPPGKGLSDLARLLARPGQPLHVSELMARQAPGTGSPAGADEVFDARARREIRQRLADLATEADDAEDAGDIGRAERARIEREQLVAALSSALGLGGRARRLDDPTEKARKTVTARIRSSIKRLSADHPSLARHLERSVDTGRWCVYNPEYPAVWQT